MTGLGLAILGGGLFLFAGGGTGSGTAAGARTADGAAASTPAPPGGVTAPAGEVPAGGGPGPEGAVTARTGGVTAPAGGRATGAVPYATSARSAPSGAPGGAPARQGDPLAPAAAFLAGRLGTVSVAVNDLATGQTWTAGDAGQPQDEASVVKLGILETLLAQHHGGLTPGQAALARQMIEDSDNDSATTLWNVVGGADGIRAFDAQAGLTSTVPSPCVRCAGFPWPGWGLTTTTALDQLTLLRQLVSPSRPLSGAMRGFALSLMENVAPDQRWGVSGGVPPRVTVALKNGWLPLNAAGTDWQINSVGWVAGLGRDYLIAVLSTGNPSEAYGIGTIDALSAIVWRQLG